MKLLFDSRVLTHKIFTGVENYAKNIFENIKEKCTINIAQPKTTNKYLAHLWTHLILPFENGDVLFCPANIAPIFVPKSKKLIVTIHDVAFLTYPKSFSTFFRIYYKIIMPFTINRADKIITVSNYSKNEIHKYYPKSKDKTEVLYLGKNNDFKKFDDEKKKNQILYVGSMNQRKNIIGVLKAYECLEIKDYKLLLVGNFSSNFDIDEETKQLIKKAEQNVNIEFKKDVTNKELIEIYNQSKLFLFPSFYEGFGLPVLEAMACGTPVVCSHSSSLPEVGGDAVVYCDPYDIKDIKEKIEYVLNDELLQKQMIFEGLQRAQLFSWEKSAAEHMGIFRKVLES